MVLLRMKDNSLTTIIGFPISDLKTFFKRKLFRK